MNVYAIVNIQHNSECREGNGESTLRPLYASRAKALERFENYLRTAVVDAEYLQELDDERISLDFDNINADAVESVIRQAVSKGSIHFVNCSVEVRQIEVDEQE